MKSGADVTRPEEVWDRYFPPSVRNLPTRDYLASATLPRPRDLIFLVKTALEFAVNRGRGRITEADILSAQMQYSYFALNSVLAEATPRIPEIDDLLLEFAGRHEIVNGDEIKVAMRRADISETRLAEVVDILTEITFIGPEILPDRFEFINDEDSLMKTRVMARKLSEESGHPTRYRINPVFHEFLEIAPERVLAVGQLRMDISSEK